VVLSASACDGEAAAPERAVVEIRTVRVADPGNTAAAIVPFHPGSIRRAPTAKRIETAARPVRHHARYVRSFAR